MKKNAHAKINLTLEILGKTNNGFHNIKSIFQEISLHDIIEIERSKTLTITFHPSISTSNSTVHEAVKLFESKSKIKIFVKITIKKNIPEKSGLGGGSSDAATTLKMLNAIYENPLKEKDILEIGKKIGADVPFFLYGHTALVEGVGEKALRVKNTTKYYGIVTFPHFAISTREAYLFWDKFGQWNSGDHTKHLIKALQNNKKIDAFLYNSFENVYKQHDYEFNKFSSKIQRITNKVFHLTGSGSAMFCLFQNKTEAIQAYKKLIENNIKAELIETL
jgi:4-diphosphocytidyl-2-C-methyl-D-erythritol kinase